MNRREALFSLGTIAASLAVAPSLSAAELKGVPHETQLSDDHMPKPAVRTGGFLVLTVLERKTLGAVYDRLLPADEYGPSATQAGCLEFIDSQLAGDYGSGKALYLEGPISPENEMKLMGTPQFLATPLVRYRVGLTALQRYAEKNFGKAFVELTNEQIDTLLTQLEAGTISLGSDIDSKGFFELLLQNVREGYLSDPVYGGNRDMAGWKMIGFPGARYDYRPYIDRRGENLSLIPVSLIPAD
ncbi:MAG TPA: gluconate 2-dehydrogenase subunit 3 family protein [Pseudomonas sp.]|uniref:gluconate 2-dehydrogenase subunit 3 family protein n=1 Tax=Pseudomonas sp. TaxID=306 RepID=UPI002B470F5E|nr:gluconate 2-dehydrogenase subunit 3 family protein [Pseudomonas sp.]HKS15625.1 gluconate 2-dehydrogenase subunit 3 family protein [Pseudomonas sp.]